MEYKTPEYQRKAYKNYYQKIKDNEEFKEKNRASQKSYYEKNRERILEQKRLKRLEKKE